MALFPFQRPLGATPAADGVCTFRVWAQEAERVAVELRGERHELAEEGYGIWSATLPAAHGEAYRYLLDDADGLPDPASRWQPDGLRGQHPELGAMVGELGQRRERQQARRSDGLFEGDVAERGRRQGQPVERRRRGVLDEHGVGHGGRGERRVRGRRPRRRPPRLPRSGRLTSPPPRAAHRSSSTTAPSARPPWSPRRRPASTSSASSIRAT